MLTLNFSFFPSRLCTISPKLSKTTLFTLWFGSCCCHATATVWHTAGFASPLPQGTDVCLWGKAHCVHRSSQLCYGKIESTHSFPTTHSSWWPNSVRSGGTSMSLKNRTGRDVDSLWPVRSYVSSCDVGTDVLMILWDTWKDKLEFPSKGLYLKK